ncbi:UvrD-helicase domain-containing protein [Cellulomonas sp. DKR-3]|uniref:UvrD-helicase domain-containing protein n=1 Tax=Cellulomonas fulva TaxID=2835530 RepID=A0ABS5TVH5_9CELL|nr:UvrD-helicase domain-containing protein [Cellulomonas fulva]MBT0993154.1 UvrD-helicase domain-containing protein [Cellulomonas fulva]
MSSTAPAGALSTLTEEQRTAAATRDHNLFIEAGPGSGKTTTSAHRFGVQRFDPAHREDPRAVAAVSFTRAATRNLRRRVQRLWGIGAVTWPHRIVTLDSIMHDVLHDTLLAGLLVWPNQQRLWPDGDIRLDVKDSWTSFGSKQFNRTAYRLTVVGKDVRIETGFVAERRSAVPITEILPRLREGICTHEDVREVLAQALAVPEIDAFVTSRLATTTRALVVDEVFDANDLDIAVIEAAIRGGVAVTMVGDPWQALYVFRGAKPHVVPDLIARSGAVTASLSTSFRWDTAEQGRLATDLRAGAGITLPVDDAATDLKDLDVVLGLWWKPLWDLGEGVLPLAFHGFKGGYEEAAATLLLNHVTRTIFDLDATYLNDALTVLAIQDRDVPRLLEPALQAVAETLRAGDKDSVIAAYRQLVEVIATVSPRLLRAPHYRHTDRLALIQSRLRYSGRPLPGLTTHQAKGGEWDAVGVQLSGSEREALASGLSITEDTHRKLYVACTRARRRTAEVRAFDAHV